MATILVIDDDANIRETFAQTLKRAGHDVLAAADGREAIRQLAAAPADLVILDLFMPTQDGLETITELRRNFPNVAIIAISGGHPTSSTMLSVALEMGAAKILEKPFKSDLLLLTVQAVLREAAFARA